MREAAIAPTFESWQAAARALLSDGVPPAEVVWRDDAPPGGGAAAPGTAQPVARVPRQFIELAGRAARHPDPARWGLLYEVLWRLVHERRDLLAAGADPQVGRLRALASQAGVEMGRDDAPRTGAGPFV